MLEELRGDVLISVVLLRQLDGDAQHVQTVHRHPGCSVGLHQRTVHWQRARAVENTDIVHTKEATLEDVQTLRILSVHPPGEIEQQLGENTLKKLSVALAALPLLRFVETQRRPSLYRRVNVAEVPLVGRKLAV